MTAEQCIRGYIYNTTYKESKYSVQINNSLGCHSSDKVSKMKDRYVSCYTFVSVIRLCNTHIMESVPRPTETLSFNQ